MLKRLAAGLPHREHLLAQQAIHRIERGVAAVRLRMGSIAGLLVANQTGRAADQRHRFVTCLLEAFQA